MIQNAIVLLTEIIMWFPHTFKKDKITCFKIIICITQLRGMFQFQINLTD